MGTRETNSLVEELTRKADLLFYYLEGVCDSEQIKGLPPHEIINRIECALDEARNLMHLAEKTHEEFWDVSVGGDTDQNFRGHPTIAG